MEQSIKAVYIDPSEPGSLGGVEPLYKRCRAKGLAVTRDDVKKLLKKEQVYTLYRPRRTHYSRNPTCVNDIDSQWQADLADFQKVSLQNSGFNYILVVIDCLSKFVWCVPVKRKDSKSMVEAFKQLFAQTHPPSPKRLLTDKGLEFLNKPVQDLFHRHQVTHFVTQNETKASMAERVIRTLKTKIYRWFEHTSRKNYVDVLQDIAKAYNNSVHRTIGMRPAEVSKAEVPKLWQKIYGKQIMMAALKDKFRDKEPVRISSAKTVFDKGYLPNWTEEVFKVSDTVAHPRKVYKIEDLEGEQIKGSFYPEELEAVNYEFPDKFTVEAILNTRRRKGLTEKLIKWKGYPERYNSWIPETDLPKYE